MQPFILPLKQTGFIRRCAWASFAFFMVISQAVVLLADDTGDVSRISADQVKKLLGRPDTVIIDVRTHRNRWRSSKKIPTATREDPSKVDQWIEKYAKDQTLIFYCS